MRFPWFNIAVCLRFFLLVLLSVFVLLSSSALQTAATLNPLLATTAEIGFPKQLGTIVYQTQAAVSSRIYIIANGHRSAINGTSTATSEQAQIETFRIGEWLINQNRIELLLPEGFFGEMRKTSAIGARNKLLDRQTLQNALADSSLFVNAELLLHKNYGISLNQIEDRKLYRHARELLHSSLKPGVQIPLTLKRELAYLQKLRSVNILQTAPVVIETEYKQGHIAFPNAMLTIGLSHLEEILAFLEAGEITMAGLHTTSSDFPALNAKLEILKRQVGVTVIVPRALINHRI